VSRFLAIWAGQLISMIGSGVTAFALAVFVYQDTGEVAHLAWIAAAAYLPHVLIGPYGGVLADRLDRRLLMIGADAGAALASAAMLACASAGLLGPWTAALLVAASAACNALQWPAHESSIVALVPVPQLGRASGLVELARGGSQLLAPLLAGALLPAIGLTGILVVDLASFAAGVIPLVLVRIPPHGAHAARPPSTRRDLLEAWRFVVARAGLVAMLALFAVTSFTYAVVELLMKPLVLSLGSPWDLGVVLSAVGVGMVVGSLTMAAWGGPRRRILAILLFQLVEGGALIAGGASPSVPVLTAAAFFYGLVIPLTFGCARTIWQLAAPAELQGRIAALRNAIVVPAIPLGYAVATPLAGALGAAPVIVWMGILTAATALAAYGFGPYRQLELVRSTPS